MRCSPAAAAVLSFVLAMGLLAPLATAYPHTNPLTLYHLGLAEQIGVVHEPDEATVHAAYNGLDGTTQRASDLSGTGPVDNGLPAGWGDGSLILDSQWYASLAGQALIDAFAAADLVRGCKSCMWPGQGQLFVWHGWWNDLDRDGRIDDSHDAAGVDGDEFLWRGAATGESFPMPLWLIPFQGNADVWAGGNRVALPNQGVLLTAFHDRSSEIPDGHYLDRTGRDQPEQGWPLTGHYQNLDFAQTWLDDGLLLTLWTITAVDARALPGTARAYDLDDPDALIDVDEYRSASPDIENLYLASTAGVFEALRDPYVETYSTLLRTIQEAGSTREQLVGGTQGEVNGRLQPGWAREPNNAGDEYPGAVWSGVPDLLGSGTDFTGYQEAWHLFADARVLMSGASQEPLPSSSPDENAQRSFKPGLFYVHLDIILWKDLNLDKWTGKLCDPEDSDQWDAEAGECRDPYRGGNRNNPQQNYELRSSATSPPYETEEACEFTDARNGVVKILPTGDWNGVYVLRNVRDATRLQQEGPGIDGPFHGSETLELRLQRACSFYGQISTSDALLLPDGTLSTGFTTRAVVTVTHRIQDPHTGIDIAAGERVVDVDFYPGVF